MYAAGLMINSLNQILEIEQCTGFLFYNGYHWCNEIRKVSKVPIIFLSSASDNMNIVMAITVFLSIRCSLIFVLAEDGWNESQRILKSSVAS